tara:strand:+ start:1773 stop:1970 length:198 start_codon:yes stop_codon:yes gene_type:complete
VNQYSIKYSRSDMPEGYVGSTIKWARTKNDAVKLILKKLPDSQGRCVFKRGGIGEIISIEQIEQK